MAPHSSEPPTAAAGVPGSPPARVSVVGPGRLGTALAGALVEAGVETLGPVGRGEPVPHADAVVLCVPDSEIPAAAAASHGAAPLVGHTSGATGLAALAASGAAAFGLHPLQTFAGRGAGAAPDAGAEPLTDDAARQALESRRFAGAGCAVAGETSAALDAARGLAVALGMRPVELADTDRAAYHAAASIASNFTVTLLAEAERVAAAAGIDSVRARALLAPLVRTTVENWAALGPVRALTGPVARNDHATVECQREAVAAAAPELEPLFAELVERTRALAGQEVTA